MQRDMDLVRAILLAIEAHPDEQIGGQPTIKDWSAKDVSYHVKLMDFEAKSAGDFTNVNKRRKEEAVKMAQLRSTYGPRVRFNLFLCGYFDGGYLGYEATELIDWVWEHRIDDLAEFGL